MPVSHIGYAQQCARSEYRWVLEWRLCVRCTRHKGFNIMHLTPKRVAAEHGEHRSHG